MGPVMARNSSVAKKPASLPATEPEPTEAEQAEIRALAKRKKTRRRAPRFTVEQEGAQVRIAPAGVHADAAAARVMNAFGITSNDLAERLMTQIVAATHIQPSGAPVAEGTLNAALAAVTGIAPRDEAEAMLAAQMVTQQVVRSSPIKNHRLCSGGEWTSVLSEKTMDPEGGLATAKGVENRGGSRRGQRVTAPVSAAQIWLQPSSHLASTTRWSCRRQGGICRRP
jgi:hypothetical protein